MEWLDRIPDLSQSHAAPRAGPQAAMAAAAATASTLAMALAPAAQAAQEVAMVAEVRAGIAVVPGHHLRLESRGACCLGMRPSWRRRRPREQTDTAYYYWGRRFGSEDGVQTIQLPL